jgi:GNAT superfamily N-acetyltransferase
MALAPEIQLRPAVFADTVAITDLIVVSSRELSRAFYSDAQIEAALAHIFGVDSTLITDGTYFVAEAAGMLCGCGGWSKRRTLFGGDQYEGRASGLSDPETDPAKIRAFFIHPEFARQGIARALLVRCETEAKAAGFRFVELMSTLPGVPFYRASGYTEAEPITHVVGGVEIGFVPMRKSLA